MKDMFDISTFL